MAKMMIAKVISCEGASWLQKFIQNTKDTIGHSAAKDLYMKISSKNND